MSQVEMEIDHIFVFSNKQGEEADGLVAFGFTEGSSRRHPGQGTINRKFYFENFFLEILWVLDENEIRNFPTSQTKLWERSEFEQNGFSPFGLCLFNSPFTDALFEGCEVYQPNYFPQGMSIDIITNENSPKLPWTFRLPYREKKEHDEPTAHANGIKRMTKATFQVPQNDEGSNFYRHFSEAESITFIDGDEIHVTLEFDNQAQRKVKEFPEMKLTILY